MQKAGLTAWKTASCPVTDEVMLQGRVRSSRYAPCIGQRRFVQRAHESASGGTTFCRVSKCARLTRLRGLSFYSGCGESSRIVDFSCQYANTPAYTMSIVSQKRRDSDGGGRCLWREGDWDYLAMRLVAAMIEVCLERALQSIDPE